MRYLHRHRKALLIVLLLCVTGLAQSAALVGQSEYHHSSDHCCLRCHVGPLPFLGASASSVAAPVFEVVCLTPAANIAATPDVLLAASPARAPPAA
jgi:hypothetical protein